MLVPSISPCLYNLEEVIKHLAIGLSGGATQGPDSLAKKWYANVRESVDNLDIVDDDGGEEADIVLPDTSSEVRLGKLVGNLVHYKLEIKMMENTIFYHFAYRIFQSIDDLSDSQDHAWGMAVQAGTLSQLFFVEIVQESKVLRTDFRIGLEKTAKRKKKLFSRPGSLQVGEII